jgi:hypothetical protein
VQTPCGQSAYLRGHTIDLRWWWEGGDALDELGWLVLNEDAQCSNIRPLKIGSNIDTLSSFVSLLRSNRDSEVSKAWWR